MRLLTVILLIFAACKGFAQGVDPEQIHEAPGRDYVLLSTDTLNSSYPINGIYVPMRLRDSLYIKGDSLCHGIFGDGRPDPCVLLPTGAGVGDTSYYWIFSINGGAPDTIILSETMNVNAGTNVTFSGNTDSWTINVDDMRDTCFHTLTQLTDSTAQLTDCNGTVRGTVTFSGVASLSDTCVQHLYALPDSSNRLVLTDCDGVPMDTVDFFGAFSYNDRYLDSLTYIGDTLTAFIRDTSGIVDSIKVAIVSDSDTDIDSVKLIGNVLHIYEDDKDRSVDLSQFLDDTDTDDQTIDVFSFDNGTRTLSLSIEDDGEATKTVIIPDDTGTDDQQLTQSTDGQLDTIFLEDGGFVTLHDSIVPDTYLDSARVVTVGQLDSIWYFRDSSGVLIDSFLIVLNDSVGTGQPDTYIDSVRHVVVGQYDSIWLYRDSSGFLVDSFLIALDDTSAVPDADWYILSTTDVPYNINDHIYHGTANNSRVRIGQDSLENSINLWINGGAAPFGTKSGITNLWRQLDHNDSIAWDRVQQADGEEFYIRYVDLGTPSGSGNYIFLDGGYTGDSVLLSISGVGGIGMGQYPNYRIDGVKEDVISLYYPDVDGTILVQPIDSIGRLRAFADFDFIRLHADTMMTLVDTLIPRDSADLHKLIWHGGRVRLGDQAYQPTIYWDPVTQTYLNTVLDQDSIDSGSGIQIYGKRSAVDIWHSTRPYWHIRNDLGEFFQRVYDPTGEGPVEPQLWQFGAVGKYDTDGMGTFDTTSRIIFQIDNDADANTLLLTDNYIQSAIYPKTRNDTIHPDSILSVLTTNAAGQLVMASADSLLIRLGVIASGTPEIDTFFLNTNDSIGLDLEGTVGPIRYVDLGAEFNVTISNDTIFQNDNFIVLPEAADSLGTAFTNNYPIVGNGTRGGKTISTFYFSADNSLNLPQIVNSGTGISTADASFEFGGNRTGDGNAYLDFHATSGADFEARLLRQSGANGDFNFTNSGTGTLNFRSGGLTLFQNNGAVSMLFATNNQVRLSQYTTTSSFTGTSIGLIGFDASGNLLTETFDNIEADMGGPFQPAGSYDNYQYFQIDADAGTTNGVFSTETLSLLGGGIVSTSVSGNTLTISATEVDGSTTNELQSFSQTSDATSHTVTLTNTSGTSFLTLAEGSGITLTTSGASPGGTVTIAATGGGSGTVTSVGAGNGMNFTTITSSGSVTLGTPSSVTLASTNSVSASSHTHAFAPGGTTSQYIRGDGSLATLPSGGGIYGGSGTVGGGSSVTAAITSGNALFFDYDGGTDEFALSGTGLFLRHTAGVVIGDIDASSDELRIDGFSGGARLGHETAGPDSRIALYGSGNIEIAAEFGTNTADITITAEDDLNLNAADIFINDDAVIGASSSNQITFTTGSTTSAIGSESCTNCSIGFTNSSNRVDLTASSGDIRFTVGSNIETSGKFSIGALYPSGAPTHILDVVGTAGLSTGTLWTNTSDRRIKRDIKHIENPYEKIMALNPVSFHYIDEWNDHKNMEDRIRYGYIAQEYQEVFPEDVSMMDEGNEWKGHRLLELSPESVVPHLVATNQQLIRDNENQAAQIKVLTEQINKLYDLINKR